MTLVLFSAGAEAKKSKHHGPQPAPYVSSSACSPLCHALCCSSVEWPILSLICKTVLHLYRATPVSFRLLIDEFFGDPLV